MSASTTDVPELSIVVPIHDEALNLRPLFEEIRAVLDRLGLSAEVIYVNDGSADDSSAVLDELRAEDSRVRVLITTATTASQRRWTPAFGTPGLE